MSAPGSPFQVASLSDVGRTRSTNQDSCGVFEDASGRRLLVVADGMGGHQGGETASQLTVEVIGEVFRSGAGPPRDLLRDAVAAANHKVFETASASYDLHGMGTTVVALLLDGDREACVAHVGDSRCYRLRDGDLELLTADHSVRRRLIEEEGLTEEEVDQHPAAHTLERAIGADADVDVEMRPMSVAPGDAFLLCSDGLWGLVSDEEIARVMVSQPPEDCVRWLVAAANRAGGRDNVTVQAVVIPGQPTAAARDAPPRSGDRTRVVRLAVAAAIVAVLAIALLVFLLGARS